jgi:iron complex outermembrane recepter protein
MKRLLRACLCLLVSQAAHAQTRDIRIKMLEQNQSPVMGATLRLIDRADTSKIQYNATDTAGVAKFKVQTGGQYRLEAAAMGFMALSKGIRASEKQTVFSFTLEPDTKSLSGVTVVARKPLLRQEEDKTIVDPEPIAATSTNAYEILEKTPGLFLDQDGNVYLNSATPANIYINGREQRMSAADIANILKNLPPNSIERLEILRTPSAKYDASGSGGVVNVVLKKGIKIGRTGSVTAGLNQGRFGNQFAGFTLNNSDGGRISNFNLSYSHRNGYDQLATTRRLTEDQSLRQDAYTRQPADGVFSGFSFGFEPRKKWELNFDGRGSYNRTRPQSTNESVIGRLSSGDVLTDNLNTLRNTGNTLFLSQGVQTKYKIDSLGSELTSDVSYNFLKNDSRQVFDIDFIVPESAKTVGGDGDIDNGRHFFAAQVDLKYKFPHKITVETGLKTALQRFNSATDYFAEVDGVRSVDPFRTNTFRYSDQIHAGYVQASKTISAYILKAGVRLENTNMDGRQSVPSDTAFRINRTDLFPYVFLSRKIMKIAGYELRGYLIHRRSITRPAYEQLNPFPRFLDQYLYEAGNPSLRPQFARNYEFNVSAGDYPVLSIGRNDIRDIFTNVIYQDPRVTSVAYRTYDNLGKNRETYFRAVGALPPGGKYFFVLGAQYNHNEYEGLYENKPIAFSRGSWTFFTYHQLRIDKRSTLSLNGFMRLKGQLQFYELSNFGNLSLNINRLFFDRKLTVTLNVNDVFFTNRNNFNISQGNITAFGKRQNDTRRVGLNVRYNFGLKKREERNNPFNIEVPGVN